MIPKEILKKVRQIQIYTHYLTIPMCIVQGYGQLFLIDNLGGFGGETKIGLTGDALIEKSKTSTGHIFTHSSQPSHLSESTYTK